MGLEKDTVNKLKQLLVTPAKITVVSHANPDGDALGSGLAWARLLEKKGHEVRFIVPNDYPEYINWMTDIGKVCIYGKDAESNDRFIAESDIIFCLDFNQIDRLESLSRPISQNEKAKKVLVDHHLNPPHVYDIEISDTGASSTSYLIYEVIALMGEEHLVDKGMAESLYVGISTDTGNFSFSNLSPELYRVVARLVEKGIKPQELNICIYNNYSKDRMRLLGHLLDHKMEFVGENAAYITLDQKEQSKFNYRHGDNEGFVNYPLSITEIKLSAFFMEVNGMIKVSLRSQGNIDVNIMARKYFNGGGHKNASGGKFYEGLDKAVETFKIAASEI